MTKNDKLALTLTIIGSIAFIAGLIIQSSWLVVPGFIVILTGAGAYRGCK